MTFNIKKIIRAKVLLLITTLALASCTSQPIEKKCTTYEEAKLPVEVTSDWSSVSPGVQASIGSIDERYIQHETPKIAKTTHWEGAAWKGERISAQIILWSKDSIPCVKMKLSNFKGENGATINAENTQTRFVRYVLTDEFAEGCGYRKPEDFAVSLSADVLDNVGCMDIDAETALPVWITIDEIGRASCRERV